MSVLVALLVYLLIGAVILYVAQLILSLWPIPSQIKLIILILIALIMLLWVLNHLGIVVL